MFTIENAKPGPISVTKTPATTINLWGTIEGTLWQGTPGEMEFSRDIGRSARAKGLNAALQSLLIDLGGDFQEDRHFGYCTYLTITRRIAREDGSAVIHERIMDLSMFAAAAGLVEA